MNAFSEESSAIHNAFVLIVETFLVTMKSDQKQSKKLKSEIKKRLSQNLKSIMKMSHTLKDAIVKKLIVLKITVNALMQVLNAVTFATAMIARILLMA